MSWFAVPSPIDAAPVTWAEIKYWLKLDDDANAEREGLLLLATDLTEWVERMTASTIVRRQRVVEHYRGNDPEAACRPLMLEVPFGPINSIVSVRNASSQDVPYELYQSGYCCAVVVPAGTTGWPIRVTYDAGEDRLPGSSRRALLMAIAAHHVARGGEADTSGVERILATQNRGVGIA